MSEIKEVISIAPGPDSQAGLNTNLSATIAVSVQTLYAGPESWGISSDLNAARARIEAGEYDTFDEVFKS